VDAVELGAPVGTSGCQQSRQPRFEMAARGGDAGKWAHTVRYFLNEIHSFANFELQNR
jgi:hypothetical protein